MTQDQSTNGLSVSVIIPCRNEAKHIAAFLDSVWKQTTSGMELEILLADGMSDDGTREVLADYQRRHCGRLLLIDNPGRIASTGLNAAIRVASGDIVIRMDCHTEYAPDYVQRCVEVLQQTKADNVGGPARTRAKGWMARAIAAAYHSPFSTGGAKFHDENYEGYVDTVTYGCWWRTTLTRLGPFDETLVRNQDDEFNLRLIRSGGKIWQSSSIVSWYWPRGRLSALFRQYAQYGFWKVPIIRKYRVPAAWRHLVPGTFILAMAALILVWLGSWEAGLKTLSTLCAVLLAVGTLSYGLASVAASAMASSRSGWSLFPLMPLVFLVYHSSYGLGFLSGLLYWTLNSSAAGQTGRAFTEISR